MHEGENGSAYTLTFKMFSDVPSEMFSFKSRLLPVAQSWVCPFTIASDFIHSTDIL